MFMFQEAKFEKLIQDSLWQKKKIQKTMTDFIFVTKTLKAIQNFMFSLYINTKRMKVL
jgi:hypothetical protein